MGKYYLLLFLAPIFSYSQIKLEEYISTNSKFESVRKINSVFKIYISDNRSYKNDKIDLNSFSIHLNKQLEIFDKNEENFQLNHIKSKSINIKIDFFNIIESSSGYVILKAIFSVRLDGGDYSNLEEEFTFSNEFFSSIKFKNKSKIKKSSLLNKIINDFSINIANDLVSSINKKIEYENFYIYKITSIGYSKVQKDSAQTIKKATLMALINGITNAFGIKIMNTSRMIDYGDVTDIIEAESGGNVLDYSIDKQKTTYTSDGYCCLLTTAYIIKKT